MESQTNMMQSNATMDPNGSSATDLDFTTTATARDEDATDELTSSATGANYPGDMNTSGYGGSASMPDDEDEDLPTDEEDDDEFDDDELDDEDDEDLIDDEEEEDTEGI